MTRRIAVSLLVFSFVFAGPLPADEQRPTSTTHELSDSQPAAETSAPAPAPSPEEDAPPPAESTMNVETSSPGNVTVDFKDADIRNVLRILSFKSGTNIVAGKDVQGAVTIRLVDVPWEKALDVILKSNGYGYDRKENIIRVASIDSLKREDLSTEVFVLNYSDASEVETAVKEILSERGRTRYDKRTNTLIVTDMPTTLQNVRSVINRLDEATPQVLIETKIVEMSLGDSDKLGINWNASVAIAGSKRPTSFPFRATQRSFMSDFFPYGRGTQTVTTDLASTTTEDFPKGKGGVGSDPIQPTFPVADKADFTFGTLDFSQFQVVLDFIKSRTDTKILSEPHVTTLNNQEAKVLVGEIIAIPTFERNTSTGRMEITGYKDRDLGIRLSVTPQINSENEIVVHIHPQIINLIGFEELTDDIRAPRYTTREAMTNVRIKSGQTIAIGGLIKEDTVDTQTSVPLLGDIPLVQNLFRHTNKTVAKTDLLFFMTVTVLRDRVPEGHKL